MRQSTNFIALLLLVWASLSATPAHAAEQVKLIVDYGDGVQKQFTELAWKEGLTVLAATQAAQEHPRGITIKVRSSGSTAFLTQIDDVKNEGNGKNWIFRVNGKLSDRSCGIYKLNDGDTVLWRFQTYE